MTRNHVFVIVTKTTESVIPADPLWVVSEESHAAYMEEVLLLLAQSIHGATFWPLHFLPLFIYLFVGLCVCLWTR